MMPANDDGKVLGAVPNRSRDRYGAEVMKAGPAGDAEKIDAAQRQVFIQACEEGVDSIEGLG